MRLETGTTSILHVNQDRRIRVNGDVDGALSSVGDATRATRAALADL